MNRWRIALALLALCSAAQTKQDSAQQSADQSVFRVTSTLIQVDAVVVDGKGHPVTDLKPEDFDIRVDGKSYPVLRANYVWTNKMPAQYLPYRTPKPKLSPPPSAPYVPLKAAQVKRTIVLMVDDLGLSWESMFQVKAALKKFILNQMQPDDLIAILRTGAGSGAIQQFTSNRDQLLDIVDHLRWNPNGNGQVGVFEPIGMMSDLANQKSDQVDPGMVASSNMGTPMERFKHGSAALLNSLGGTFGALQYTVEALQEMPGRKSIVLFSDGFVLAGDDYQRTLEVMLDDLIDAANRAGTVFYTIDPRGLVYFGPGAQDRVVPSETTNMTEVLAGIERSRSSTFYSSQQGLSYLAEKTGGLAYQNGNDLNFGLTRVLEDQQGYYLLAFKPDASLFSAPDSLPKYNHMAVHVSRPGLHVRSRTGFLGRTDQQMRQSLHTPGEQLRVAMLSPFLASDIHVSITALYAAVKNKKDVVRNLFYIDPKDLDFKPNQIGQSVAKIQLLAVAVGPKGEPLAEIANEYTIQAPTDRLPKILNSGLIYSLDVSVPHPGPYQIRAAIRDESSSAIGSAHQYIDVPDVRKTKLALTSLMLGTSGVKAQNPNAMLLAAARRQFTPGDRITYASLLEGAAATNSTPDVHAELVLFRNNHAIFSTPVKVTQVNGGPWAVSGYVKLPADFDPGQYYIELIARDAAHPNLVAWQWADFEVIRPTASLQPVGVTP